MEQTELEAIIDDLEGRVERLRALYDQYFMGIEKIEPLTMRKEVDRRLWQLRREQIRNTRTRFKLQMTIQRYNTYQQYWARICREIENGTYHRDLSRAYERFGDTEATTLLAKKRQKMIEKGQAKKAERDIARQQRQEALGLAPPRPQREEQAAEAAPPPEEAMPVSVPRPLTAKVAPAAEPAGGSFERLELDMEDFPMGGPIPKPAPVPSATATPALPKPAGPAQRQVGALPPVAAPPARPPLPSTPGAAGPITPPPASATRPVVPGARPPAGAVPGARPNALPPAVAPPQQARPPAVARPPGPVPGGVAQPPAARPPSPVGPAATPARVAPAGRAAAPPQPVRRPTPHSVPPPAAARPPAAPPAAARAPTASVPGDGISESRTRQIYKDLVEAKRKCNESTASVTYDGLVKTLRDSESRLRERHKGRNIDFEVVVKDGKTLLKPVVKG